jgi:hypothetical protein
MSGSTAPPAATTAQDLIEQSARIENLEADTALKIQQIKYGRANLSVAIFGVVVAGVSIMASAVQFFYSQAHPEPKETYIFLSAQPPTVLQRNYGRGN